MKKIFTILLAAGSISFASAQSVSHNDNFGHNDKTYSRDRISGQSTPNEYRNNTSVYNNSSFDTRDRDEQMQRINWGFDQRIEAIQRDRHLRSYEKSRQIKMLERQREEQIKQSEMRSSSHSWSADNRYSNHNDDHHNDHKW